MEVGGRFCILGKQGVSGLSEAAEQEPGCPGPVPGENTQPTPPVGGGEITGEGSKQPK